MSKEIIIGIDEAGRGALAGPVCVCSACILNPTGIQNIKLNDSKKMTPKQRADAMKQIVEAANNRYLDWVVSYQHADTIDKVNILEATKRGARVAVAFAGMHSPDNVVFKIDGDVDLVGDTTSLSMLVTTECIVQGDGKVPEIMLASIIAKYIRDQHMIEMDVKYPGYDFAKSKGYCSPKHLEGIAKQGICDIHRKTFAKVKEHVS